MLYSDNQKYWIWLSSIHGLDSKQFFMLLHEYGEPVFVWDQLILAKKMLSPAVYRHLEAARCQAYMDDLFGGIDRGGLFAVTQLDETYPDRLRSIPEAPPTLFARGCPEVLNPERAFAIVGSRKVTLDGARITKTIASGLAVSNVVVVSGLALGADRCAHEGCLEGDQPTIAVLGNSVESIYPKENEELGERIVQEGGVLVSEYPPGTRAFIQNFPRRNRIISGLSDGVLMTEGTSRSGAMITMNYARIQNKPRFAVPGSVYSQASEGTNGLLVDGAHACLGAEQVLSYFDWGSMASEAAAELPELDDVSLKILEILRFEEKSFDELANIMKMDISSLNSLLTILEMQGIIRQSAGKMYRAIV